MLNRSNISAFMHLMENVFWLVFVIATLFSGGVRWLSRDASPLGSYASLIYPSNNVQFLSVPYAWSAIDITAVLSLGATYICMLAVGILGRNFRRGIGDLLVTTVAFFLFIISTPGIVANFDHFLWVSFGIVLTAVFSREIWVWYLFKCDKEKAN